MPDRRRKPHGEASTLTPSVCVSSVTVIIRVEEFDIAIGDTRLALLRHVKDGHRFLWPVLRQKPSVQITEGILGGCVGSFALHM